MVVQSCELRLAGTSLQVRAYPMWWKPGPGARSSGAASRLRSHAPDRSPDVVAELPPTHETPEVTDRDFAMLTTAAPSTVWPERPPAGWKDTCATLHMLTQIVGKTRLALAPMENHWWNVALYLTARGLTTSPMPCGGRAAEVEFDFIDHQLLVRTGEGDSRTVALRAQPVADFHQAYREALRSLALEVRIRPVPVEIVTAIPFAEDRVHTAYDPDAAEWWWRLVAQADRVLKRFRGRFLGKQSPVHFFWGSFDLAATRFSGRPAPEHPGGAPNCPDYVMVEAYSRECSSCGFWAGGDGMADPAFYAYAYPEPAGYADRPAGPAGASYSRELREFILPYEAVRVASSPDDAVLEFCQATYDAAADLGRWDRPLLDRNQSSGSLRSG